MVTHIDFKGMTKWQDNGLLTIAGLLILLAIALIGATVVSGIDMISQFGNMKIGE